MAQVVCMMSLHSQKLGHSATEEDTVGQFREISAFYRKYTLPDRTVAVRFLAPSLLKKLCLALFTVPVLEENLPTSREVANVGYPLFWVFQFPQTCFYYPRYSSLVLGQESRPSIAAVILDICDLVKNLSAADDNLVSN